MDFACQKKTLANYSYLQNAPKDSKQRMVIEQLLECINHHSLKTLILVREL